MNQFNLPKPPQTFSALEKKCEEIGFTMPSDSEVGALLRTLVASKPSGNILELGTGIGLSLSWLADGLDQNSQLTSVDNDPKLINIVNEFFGEDSRINIICGDGAEWIQKHQSEKFDLIFADAWPGKYSELDGVLEMVKTGGFYIIDDMKPHPNWPEGHAEKAANLMQKLESLPNFVITQMDWSTGVVVATKTKA